MIEIEEIESVGFRKFLTYPLLSYDNVNKPSWQISKLVTLGVVRSPWKVLWRIPELVTGNISVDTLR